MAISFFFIWQLSRDCYSIVLISLFRFSVIARKSNMTGSIRIFEKSNFTPKLSVLVFLKIKLPNMIDWHKYQNILALTVWPIVPITFLILINHQSGRLAAKISNSAEIAFFTFWSNVTRVEPSCPEIGGEIITRRENNNSNRTRVNLQRKGEQLECPNGSDKNSNSRVKTYLCYQN